MLNLRSSKPATGLCYLVFGVSGVGKTRACEEFGNRHPDYLITRASRLLSNVTHLSSEALQTTNADGILRNQTLLVKEFRKFRTGRETMPVILEAHATIYNGKELIQIPIEIIEFLEPDRLVLIEARSVEVLERRKNDQRQRPIREIHEIQEELVKEREAVEFYSRILNLPLLILESDHNFQLDAAII